MLPVPACRDAVLLRCRALADKGVTLRFFPLIAEFNKVGHAWPGLAWPGGPALPAWAGLGWAGLGWAGGPALPAWAGLAWPGLAWARGPALPAWVLGAHE